MKLENAKISILIGAESTTIELIDDSSSITFARVKLTPEELSSCLSRQAYVSCQTELKGLDKVGKKMENKDHCFIIPNDLPKGEEKDKELLKICNQTIPEGWIADSYFRSQNSFFTKDGVNYARATIRRWI